jgi:hypothetical protein
VDSQAELETPNESSAQQPLSDALPLLRQLIELLQREIASIQRLSSEEELSQFERGLPEVLHDLRSEQLQRFWAAEQARTKAQQLLGELGSLQRAFNQSQRAQILEREFAGVSARLTTLRARTSELQQSKSAGERVLEARQMALRALQEVGAKARQTLVERARANAAARANAISLHTCIRTAARERLRGLMTALSSLGTRLTEQLSAELALAHMRGTRRYQLGMASSQCDELRLVTSGATTLPPTAEPTLILSILALLNAGISLDWCFNLCNHSICFTFILCIYIYFFDMNSLEEVLTCSRAGAAKTTTSERERTRRKGRRSGDQYTAGRIGCHLGAGDSRLVPGAAARR